MVPWIIMQKNLEAARSIKPSKEGKQLQFKYSNKIIVVNLKDFIICPY